MEKEAVVNLNKFVQEVGEWGLRNFGEQPSWTTLHGIGEELGELIEVLTNTGDCDDAHDAIGDTMVFIAHFCFMTGRDLQMIWERRELLELGSGEHTRTIFVAYGRILHHHLKMSQRIRGTPKEHNAGIDKALGHLLCELNWVANGSERLLGHAEETWARVKQRNWKKDPKAGGET